MPRKKITATSEDKKKTKVREKKLKTPKVNESIQAIKSREEYKKIKQCLLDQLKQNGNYQIYFTDLVEDYMELWVEKELLKEDIDKRGVIVEWNNGDKQSGFKKNESLMERRKTQTEMSKILSVLNLTFRDRPVNPSGEENGEKPKL